MTTFPSGDKERGGKAGMNDHRRMLDIRSSNEFRKEKVWVATIFRGSVHGLSTRKHSYAKVAQHSTVKQHLAFKTTYDTFLKYTTTWYQIKVWKRVGVPRYVKKKKSHISWSPGNDMCYSMTLCMMASWERASSALATGCNLAGEIYTYPEWVIYQVTYQVKVTEQGLDVTLFQLWINRKWVIDCRHDGMNVWHSYIINSLLSTVPISYASNLLIQYEC